MPLSTQSLANILQLAGNEGQMDGKLCSSGEEGTHGKDLPVCTCMCGSAHDCGCVVNGSSAMAASYGNILSIICGSFTIAGEVELEGWWMLSVWIFQCQFLRPLI